MFETEYFGNTKLPKRNSKSCPLVYFFPVDLVDVKGQSQGRPVTFR